MLPEGLVRMESVKCQNRSELAWNTESQQEDHLNPKMTDVILRIGKTQFGGF